MGSFRIPKTVVFLGLASLFNDIATEAIYPVLPFFLGSLGASVLFIGAIEGTVEAVLSFTKLAAGYLSDTKFSRQPFIFIGYGASAILRPLLGAAVTPWQVFGLRVLDRVGKGFRTAPRDAWLADYASKENRAKIYGFHRGMDNLGATIAPLLAAAFLLTYPGQYRKLFVLTLIPGLLVLVALHWARKYSKNLKATAHFGEKPKLSLRDLPTNFKIFLAAMTFFMFAASSDAFILLRLKEVGVSISMIPVYWAVLNLVKTGGAFFGGRTTDLIGDKTSIILGWIFYALAYFLFAFIHSPIGILGVFLVYGLYFGLTETAEPALVSAIVPSQKRGTAFGYYHLITSLGVLPASLLFGLIWEKASSFHAFIFGGGVALAASLLFILVPVKNRAENLSY